MAKLNDDVRAKLQKVSQEILKKLDTKKKDEILDLAQKLVLVLNDKSLSRSERVSQLKRLLKTKEADELFRNFASTIKAHSWTNQSWARRLMIFGALVGFGGFGSMNLGIATAGMGIALSVGAATTILAGFLGALIDEIKKEKDRRSTPPEEGEPNSTNEQDALKEDNVVKFPEQIDKKRTGTDN